MAKDKTEEIKVLHAALEATKGHIPSAAALIGISAVDVHNRINSNKFLRDFWKNGAKKDGIINIPSEADQVSRPLPPPYVAPPPPTEQEIAAAFAKEDALVKNGLENAGLSEKLTTLAIALQNFQGRHFRRTIEMIGGGITVQYLRVMAEIEKIDGELDGELTPAREMLLREDRSRLLAVMSQFYDRAQKAVLVSAKVKQMENGSDAGVKRSAKPGFAALERAKPTT